jgi:hypothetical protein
VYGADNRLLCVIVFFVSILVSMEINTRHYFRSDPRVSYPSVMTTAIYYTRIVLKIPHTDFKETTYTIIDFTYKEVINILWLHNIFSNHELQTPLNRNISV